MSVRWREAARVVELRLLRTSEMSAAELAQVRGLLDAAFVRRFHETDWQNTIGGLHVVVHDDGVLVAHAAVVARTLIAGRRRLVTGYVEGVATLPTARHRGHATTAMDGVGDVIRAQYELGALSADVPGLYARLGWEPWLGPTYVDAPDGRRRTPEDDGGVMVLRSVRTADLDLADDLTCDWRAGDVW